MELEKTKPHRFRSELKKDLGNLYQEYHSLNHKTEKVDCPFCHSASNRYFCSTGGFTYVECESCKSLFTNPKPSSVGVEWFYKQKPTKKIDEVLLPTTTAYRQKEDLGPRLDDILGDLEILGVQVPLNSVVEVGAGTGTFLELVQKNNVAVNCLAIEPTIECVQQIQKIHGIDCFHGFLEKYDGPIEKHDAVFVNSVIEHPYEIDIFFSKLVDLLKPGGHLILTDMDAEGLDIRCLREEAPNVNPILIHQVASKVGLTSLGKKHGLSILMTKSTGKLDIELIYEHLFNSKNFSNKNPLTYLLENKDAREELQQLANKYELSGYRRTIFKKG